jgi:hypothetical protein
MERKYKFIDEKVIGCDIVLHRIQAVRDFGDDPAKLDARLLEIFPKDLRVAKWNRECVQKGMSEMGREALNDAKRKMEALDRTDIISFADMIDFDEQRIP